MNALVFLASLAITEWAVVLDLPPSKPGYIDFGKEIVEIHAHSPEELNGGGYRNGKFVYIYQHPREDER